MILDQKVEQILTGCEDITEIVGNRIFPDYPADDPRVPFMVYYCERTDDTLTLDPTDTVSTRTYQLTIDCWGNSVRTVIQLKEILHGLLHYYDENGMTAVYTDDITPVEQRGFHRIVEFKVFNDDEV